MLRDGFLEGVALVAIDGSVVLHGFSSSPWWTRVYSPLWQMDLCQSFLKWLLAKGLWDRGPPGGCRIWDGIRFKACSRQTPRILDEFWEIVNHKPPWEERKLFVPES